jgi:PAS domain S-box-containing protein
VTVGYDQRSAEDPVFAGPGELRALCRSFDWSATPLGPVEGWPGVLRTTVRVCLDAATVPMAIWAGPELTLVYNDAYAPVLGSARHPGALGRPAGEVWRHLWDRLGPELRRLMERGESSRREDERFLLRRGAREEEAFFTCSFTPIRDDDGKVVAALNVVHETTERVRSKARRDDAMSFALTMARMGAWEFDLEARTADRSPQHDRIFGYDQPLPEWTYETFLQHVVPEDRREVDRVLRRAVETRSDWAFECRIARRDGAIRWVWAAGRHLADGNGGPRRMVGVIQDITERRRSEEALRASEALARQRLAELETIYETAPIGLCVFDENLRWVRVNRVIAEINGKPIEDIVGRTPSEVVPDVGPQAEEALRTILRTGERLDFEMHGTTSAQPGVERCWSEHWAPIKDGTGRVVAISVAAEEITERKRAARALAESERRFRTLAENAPEVIARLDRDLRYTYVNEYGGRVYGRPVSEVIGKTIAELGSPAARVAFWKRVFEQVIATGEPRTEEVEWDSPTFGHQHLSTLLVPERDERGECRSILAITRDVTLLKRAGSALRESEARLRRLADAMPQLVWTARPDGTVDYFNERINEVTGARRRKDGSWYWEGMLHPDDVPATVMAWTTAVRTGEPYEIAHRVKRADGALHWYLSRGVPVHDADGRIVRWFGTATDIHAQKSAEEALREADRRKNEFLAMLSHELRNPLAPIKNCLYILERAAPGGPQARRAQDVVARQVEHMTRLIDDLLDVTRISRGKIRLQRERVDLCALVHRAAEDHRSVFEASGIRLETRTCEGPLHASGDPTRLAQVIGNLLSNAAKFTPRGGRVELSLTSEEGTATIRVRDDGGGISREVLDRLFQPFVQARATLDRSEGGLGLGLALVKGLAELHGGRVSARSEGPGTGAEFTVNLPLEQAGAPRLEVGPRRSSARKVRRVLVIEDNADAAETLKEVLELNGHEVQTASTGQEGIEAAHAFHPDVVLCDIGLPGMDGFEVARRMRADPELRAVPLIALSGYTGPEDLARAKEAGFDRHLAKPPEIAALESALSEAEGPYASPAEVPRISAARGSAGLLPGGAT